MQINAHLLLIFLPAILAVADLKAEVKSKIGQCDNIYDHIKTKMMSHPIELVKTGPFTANLNQHIHDFFDGFMKTYYDQVDALKTHFHAPAILIAAVNDQIAYETLKSHQSIVERGIQERNKPSKKHLFSGKTHVKSAKMTDDLKVEMIQKCQEALKAVELKIRNLIDEFQRIAKEIAKQRFLAIDQGYSTIMLELVEIIKDLPKAVKDEIPKYKEFFEKKRAEAEAHIVDKADTTELIQAFYQQLAEQVIKKHIVFLHAANLHVTVTPTIPKLAGSLVEDKGAAGSAGAPSPIA